jgi:hypothetical protein
MHTLAVPALIYLAAPLAMAQSQPQPQSAAQDYPMISDQSVSTVRVTAPQSAFDASPEQVDWISGAYRMSNGWRLDVQPAPNGIVAKIDKERPMRLVAVSDDRYVTLDGNVAMTFNRGAHGDDMLMSYVPRSNLAALVVARSSLARR